MGENGRCISGELVYTIAERHSHPPWGVTADLLVCDSRFNHTIQFKSKFPRTGGGKDVDFIFQLKQYHEGTVKENKELVVSVPGAKVTHPWWRSGRVCYGHICGWAKGDSIRITERPEKTYLVCPNWSETIFLISIITLVLNWSAAQLTKVSITLVILEIITKTWEIYLSRLIWTRQCSWEGGVLFGRKHYCNGSRSGTVCNVLMSTLVVLIQLSVRLV